MAETRPRDLTAEELAGLQAPPGAEWQSAPLRIPPGTDVAIELLNPAGETAVTSFPTAVPVEQAGAGSGSGPTSAAAGPSPQKH
jgi:hypothetical protein